MTAISQTFGAAVDERSHPLRAAAGIVVASFAVIVGVLIAVGLALTHLGVFAAAMRWDHHTSVWFVDHRTPTLDRVSAWFTWIANTMGIVVVAAAITAWAAIRRWGRRALLLVTGLGLELASFLTSNYTVRRPRPDVQHLGSTPSTFSWPSGHVAATFVLYGGIALLVTWATTRLWPRVAAWTVAASLTTLVALSRVYRGEHHALDVMAGALLGIAALTAASLVVRRPDEEAAR